MEALLDAIEIGAPDGPAGWLALVGLVGLSGFCTFRAAGAPAATLAGGIAIVGFVFVEDFAIPAAIAAMSLGLLVRGRLGHRVERPGWRTVGAHGVLVSAGYLAYELARLHSEGGMAEATANSLDLLSFEQGASLYVEPHIQDWFLGSEPALRAITNIYSYWFLAFVVSVLVWLFLADRRAYRAFVTGLGVSAAATALIIWLYPVAPPRMLAEPGLVDVKSLLGREHHYANELAAMPSLHVGWTTLAGLALWRSSRRWQLVILGPLPGLVMLLAVVVTGNHYWIDGAAGVALALLPAAVATRAWRWRALDAALQGLRATRETLAHDTRAQTSTFFLSGLLVYLLAGQLLRPGFTDYWGYLVFQMAVTLVLLIAGSTIFRQQGGLSWWTHAIAVSTSYADTFGTAGDLYARIDEYDKLTHFFGVAAITAGAYDCFRGLHRRGLHRWVADERLLAAITIGVMVGVAWECYEFVGDRVFGTSRVGGMVDTTNDLISDTLGAVTAGFVLWRAERQEREAREKAGAGLTET